MSAVEVIPVTTSAELHRFIKLPMVLNAGDPNYVPPLFMEREEALSPKKNPFFAHAETQFWLARIDGRDVGRITAQIDHLVTDKTIGHFGMVVAIDDAAVFTALFDTAEAWLKARGKRHIFGPFNLSINEDTGLLIDGFYTPPMFLMGHDPKYVGPQIEARGYAKAKDVIAYLYELENPLPAAARRMIDRRRPTALTVRNLDMKRYDAEMETVTSIFNDAWSENWGFIPFTEAEIKQMAKSLKPLINPKYAAIVEMNGEAVGFGITLPNLNEIIADFDGKLLPFNWIKLLLGIKKVKTARTPLMGIRRTFAAGMVGGLAPFLIIDKMRQGLLDGGSVKQVELSWILEDNKPMRHVCEALGATAYKTYRVYDKVLA